MGGRPTPVVPCHYRALSSVVCLLSPSVVLSSCRLLSCAVVSCPVVCRPVVSCRPVVIVCPVAYCRRLSSGVCRLSCLLSSSRLAAASIRAHLLINPVSTIHLEKIYSCGESLLVFLVVSILTFPARFYRHRCFFVENILFRVVNISQAGIGRSVVLRTLAKRKEEKELHLFQASAIVHASARISSPIK